MSWGHRTGPAVAACSLPLLPGDRYVLREAGRAETWAGERCSTWRLSFRPSRARPDRSVERVVTERGWMEVGELTRLTGRAVLRPPSGMGGVGRGADCRPATSDTGRRRHPDLGLPLSQLTTSQRAVLAKGGSPNLVVADGYVRPVQPDRRMAPTSTTDPRVPPDSYIVYGGRRSIPRPPPDVERAELRHLERRGFVVESQGSGSPPRRLEAAMQRWRDCWLSSRGRVDVRDPRELSNHPQVRPSLGRLSGRQRGDPPSRRSAIAGPAPAPSCRLRKGGPKGCGRPINRRGR